MLKLLAIFALLALGLGHTAQSQVQPDRSQQKKPAEGGNSGSHATDKPSIPPVQLQLASPNQANDSQQRPSAYPWRELLAPSNIPNWFLIVVGAFAGLMALRTLKAINRQADLMKEQSDLAVGKERAKLRIELKPFRPVRTSDDLGYEVVGSISIHGYTEAFVERTEIYACVGHEGVLNPLPEWLFPIPGVPPVIRDGTPPIEFWALVIAKDGPATDEEILPVQEKNASLFCRATIEFSDAFGRKWILRLRQRFEFLWATDRPDGIGTWVDDGPLKDNGEFRVKDDQSPEPN
jgi:hypothetical protein